MLYLGPLHFLKKRRPKVDCKSTASYMIANSEINENGIIFSLPPLVGPAGFLKNQFNNSTLPFFWKFYCPFRKGLGDRKDLICKDVYLYAVWVY